MSLNNPFGSEFPVNSTTTNEQRTGIPNSPPPQSIAIDQDGDFVVTWTSYGQDGSGYGIYAQRYNAAGVAQGGEFQVNTTTDNIQQNASVAMDSDGDFIITWESYDPAAGYKVYAQRYSANGAPQGGEFQVNTFDANAQRFSSVAMDADGDFVITWSSNNQDGSGYGIYAQRYDAAGGPQGGEFRVSTTTANQQRNSKVAMDAAGNFVVAWTGVQTNQEDIFFQLYDSNGIRVGDETRVNINLTSQQQDVSVAMDGDGDFVVTWASLNQDGNGWGIYARCYTAGGVAKGEEFLVNSTPLGDQRYPSVSMDADGDFIVSWANINGSSREIYARRFNVNGVAQGSEYQVNTVIAGTQQNAAIALDADGDSVVAWATSTGGVGDIAARIFKGSELPSTTGIASFTVPENSPNVEIDLFAAFSDVETPDASLGYAVMLNTNAGLFASPPSINPITGKLTLDFDPIATGASELTIRATDQGGRFVDTIFKVTVAVVDDPPVLSTTSTGAVAFTENGAAVVIDPNVIPTDADSLVLQSATVTITNYVAGQDLLIAPEILPAGMSTSFSAGVLTITGEASIAAYQSVLRAIAYANASDAPNLTNRILEFRVSDGNGFSNSTSRTVTVAAVNDAPTIAPATGTATYIENDVAVAIAPTLSLVDVDNVTLNGATVSITNFVAGEDNLGFTLLPGITGSFVNGTLTLTGSAAIADYQAVLQSITYTNSSDNPTSTPRTIEIRVSDGTDNSAIVSRTVNITSINDVPVVAVGSGALSYTENGAPLAIDSTLTVNDLDNTTLTGATVTISGNFVAGQDVLSFTPVIGITGSYSNGVLTFTGSASFTAYQTVLRSVAYSNSSENPSPLERTIQFQVTDGTDLSNIGARTISVVAVNDVPSLVTTAGGITYTESALPLAIDSTVAVSDLDDLNLEGAIVRITNFVAGEDNLSFTPQPGITGTVVNGVLTLTGSASVAAYQTVLRSVAYSNSSNTPTTTTRIVEYLVNDGDANSAIGTRTVQVIATNDVPSVVTSAGTVPYTENDPAIAIDPAVALSDTDSTSLASATVTIANFVAEDSLGFTPVAGITGSYSNGVLTFTGTASIADYQILLRSVTYRNSSEAPNITNRTIEFRVNDGTTTSNPATRVVTVAAVNDAPVVTATAGSLLYSENAGAVALDTGLAVSDIDSATLTGATVRITNAVAVEDVLNFTPQFGITGSFTGGVLTLTGTTTLENYQTVLRSITYTNISDTPTATSRVVEFQVTDAGGLSSPVGTRTIQISTAPEPPVVTPTAGALLYSENAGAVAIDPTLGVSDIDSATLAGATVRIINFVAGQDNLSFTPQLGITGSFSNGVLTFTGTASVADYQTVLRSIAYTNSSPNPNTTDRTIEFQVNDGGLSSNAGTRIIQLAAIDSPPAVATSAGSVSYSENTTDVTIDTGVAVSDPDSINLTGATVRITNAIAAEDVLNFTPGFGITGSFANGVLTLTGTTTLANYQTVLRSVTYGNISDAPTTTARTIEFQINDGTSLSNLATRTVTLTPSNDPPVVTPSTGAATYTENGAPVLVDAGLLLSDVDSATLSSATVTISNFVSGEDSLTFNVQPGITGSFSNGVLTLTGTAPIADYQTVLRSITYSNSSANPTTAVRNIQFQVNDGTSPSNIGSRSLQINSLNSAPVVTASSGSVTYTEDAPALAIDTGLGIADPDSTTLAGATVRIANFVAGEDLLSFTPQLGITGSFSGDTLTLTGTASLATYQTLLRSVTYRNSSNTPTLVARTIEFQVNDGSSPSNIVSRTVSVASVNDAPVIAPATGSATFTEKGAAIAFTSGLTLTDPDSPTLAGATVQITNFVAAEDSLNFTPVAGITSSFNNGVLTLTGTASIADYQTLLQSLTYSNTSISPTPVTRNIQIQTNDGQLASTPVTRTVQIVTVNDAPSVTTSPTAITYTEDAPAVAIDAGLTLSDLDSPTLSGAIVTLGNYVPGQDILTFTNQLGIIGSFNVIAGVLNLSGVSSIANYEAALRSITYRNTSENPNPTSRTLTFVVNDGTSSSAAATRTLQVVAANDVPIVITAGSPVDFSSITGAVPIDESLQISDVDSISLTGATVTLTNYIPNQDVLSFASQSGITGSFDAATGKLTLTGTASIAAYQAALRSVTYNNSSTNPDSTTRTVEFQVNDGSALSAVAARSIQIAFNSTPPVLDLNGTDPGTDFTATYTIGAPPIRIVDTDLTLTDIDSPTLNSAVVVIANPLNLVDERLDAVTAGTGITADYNPAASRLTLIGTASRAFYQQVLRSITYSNSSGAADLTTRSIVFTVNDGDFTSELRTSIVNLRAPQSGGGPDPVAPSLVTTLATDVINASSANDTVASTVINLQQSDIINAGAGTDTLMLMDGIGTVSIEVGNSATQMSGITPTSTLITNFERFDFSRFSGTATMIGSDGLDDLLMAGAGNDSLFGAAGDDTLMGNAGNDTLDGGSGTDSLTGGSGDDLYLVDLPGDRVSEDLNGGTDTVQAESDFVLGANLENLTLVSTAVAGTGNALDNTLTGNDIGNFLAGGAANDSLIGNGGSDSLVGGGGSDRLTGGSGRDRLNGGAGKDSFYLTSARRSDRDAIVGFNTKADTIFISQPGFSRTLKVGKLLKSQFTLGRAAADRDDRFIYNRGSGALFFDADGLGGKAQVQIATITNKSVLTSADFVITTS